MSPSLIVIGFLLVSKKVEETTEGFKVEFGKIDTAYRIKYTTEIDDYSKAPYTNDAILTDNDAKKGSTTATADVVIGKTIEKSGTAYKGNSENSHNSTKITWTIDVNKSESNIINAKVNDSITDSRLTIDDSSIKVYYLEKDGSGWKQGSEATSIDVDKFPINLGDTNGKAYRIVFDTTINYGETYAPANTFKNTATLTGDNIQDSEAPAEVNVTRGTLLEKDGYEATKYDDPNIKWTVHVNKAEQTLKNAVVTDTIGSGLKYRDGTLKIYDNTTLITPENYAAC